VLAVSLPVFRLLNQWVIAPDHRSEAVLAGLSGARCAELSAQRSAAPQRRRAGTRAAPRLASLLVPKRSPQPQRLARLFERRGLSVRAISKASGVPHRSIQRMLGGGGITLETASKLVRAFDWIEYAMLAEMLYGKER